MKYTHQYQTKWHDTDANRELRPSQILMYMQETANLQLLDSGLSLDTLRDQRGLAFLLSRIAVRMHEPIYAHETIDVETWICESRGFSFNRCFAIRREGRVVAEAVSVWALMDLKEMRLCRVSEFEYPFLGDAMIEVDLPRRVHFSPDAAARELGERVIRYADIDYNGHMNNTRYPDMLCDFLPNVMQKRVTGYTLSYLHEATYGHTLKVFGADGERSMQFRTVDGDGTVCLEAYLEFEEREVRSGSKI